MMLIPPERSLFQSTRPVRGATQRTFRSVDASACFNPRAPCGARLMSAISDVAISMFQSTRPMRGATGIIFAREVCPIVSIHAPHAGRDRDGSIAGSEGGVSIHAPRAGRDLHRRMVGIYPASFNPRAPCGARP